MTTLTREQIKRLRNDFECWQQDYDPTADREQYKMFGDGMAAMDMLLAAMQQEPVKAAGFIQIEGHGTDEFVFKAYYKALVNVGDRLYTSPTAPVSVPDDSAVESLATELMKRIDKITREYHGVATLSALRVSIVEACRAAMIQGKAEPVSNCDELNSPVIQDSYCVMPMKLTVDNGAKGALSGEFSETKFINCPECFGDDECETCDGSGRIEITVPVTWTTIKAIWAKGVEHFTAAPQQ